MPPAGNVLVACFCVAGSITALFTANRLTGFSAINSATDYFSGNSPTGSMVAASSDDNSFSGHLLVSSRGFSPDLIDLKLPLICLSIR